MIAAYDGLDWQVQEDLDVCVADKISVHPGQVMEFFKKHPPKVQIIWVDPASLIGPEGREVGAHKVREYQKTWKTKPDVFPPVVIDSDRPEHAICEGGHRTTSAKKAKIPWIRAIDIAAIIKDYPVIMEMRATAKAYSKKQETVDEPWWLARYQGRA